MLKVSNTLNIFSSRWYLQQKGCKRPQRIKHKMPKDNEYIDKLDLFVNLFIASASDLVLPRFSVDASNQLMATSCICFRSSQMCRCLQDSILLNPGAVNNYISHMPWLMERINLHHHHLGFLTRSFCFPLTGKELRGPEIAGDSSLYSLRGNGLHRQRSSFHLVSQAFFLSRA